MTAATARAPGHPPPTGPSAAAPARGSQRHGPALAAGAAGVYAAGLLVVDPFQSHVVGCPLFTMTGLLCPGCGSSRAAHELLHGDVAGSLACHPLVVPVVLLLLWLWLSWLARSRGLTTRWARSADELPAWLLKAVAVTFVAFTLLRNVPGFDWLVPPTTAP